MMTTMTHLLCRNRVTSYEQWHAVFRANEEAAREAGLVLEFLWQEKDDPNNVFFLFSVESIDKAEAFMAAPDAGEAAQESCVIEGEYHFVESHGQKGGYWEPTGHANHSPRSARNFQPIQPLYVCQPLV